jgi:hypothetical protein
MLHMFAIATHVFHTYVASVSSRRMLKVFYLDVAKVDLVLYMLH